MIQKIFIKERKRKAEEMQFYMHQFAETSAKVGIPVVREIVVTYRFHLNGIFYRLIQLVYRFGFHRRLKDKALIITSRGEDLLANATPYYLKYEIIPMLWDVWPNTWEHLGKTFKLLKIRTVLVTVKSMAEKLHSEYGLNAIWVPEGIDTTDYHYGVVLAKRKYDICELGRQYEPYHKVIQSLYKKGKINGYFRTQYDVNGKVVTFAFPTNEEMYEKLPQTKIMVNFPKSITHPEEAGLVETLTQRYWEAMLCGCLIIGKAPLELIELMGYNPVIEIDWTSPEGQLESILSHIEDYQKLVERNYTFAIDNAAWDHRFPFMMSSLKQLDYSL